MATPISSCLEKQCSPINVQNVIVLDTRVIKCPMAVMAFFCCLLLRTFAFKTLTAEVMLWLMQITKSKSRYFLVVTVNCLPVHMGKEHKIANKLCYICNKRDEQTNLINDSMLFIYVWGSIHAKLTQNQHLWIPQHVILHYMPCG